MNSHHTLALEQALTWIKETFQPLGVLVSGSIVRGNPSAASDFDIFVIHERNYRQRIQKRFNGVACEIFVNTVAQTRSYFEDELRANRPVTAHMLATGQLVWGVDNTQVQALLTEAKQYNLRASALTAEQLTFQRYGIATLFEDATDLLATDQATSLYALEKVVAQVVELVFVMQQQPLPRLKERLRALEALAPVAGSLITRFYQTTDLLQRYELAKSLLLEVIGELGFFEWHSVPFWSKE